MYYQNLKCCIFFLEFTDISQFFHDTLCQVVQLLTSVPCFPLRASQYMTVLISDASTTIAAQPPNIGDPDSQYGTFRPNMATDLHHKEMVTICYLL